MRRHKIFKRKNITSVQYARLKALGVWKHTSALESKWEEKYEELAQYRRRFKDCNVLKSNQPYNALARWVYLQRRLKTLNKLTPDRSTKLDALDFIWNQLPGEPKFQFEKQWLTKFRQLEHYKFQYKNTNVPYQWKKGLTLAKWVATQRLRYYSGKLRKVKIEKLNALSEILQQ